MIDILRYALNIAGGSPQDILSGRAPFTIEHPHIQRTRDYNLNRLPSGFYTLRDEHYHLSLTPDPSVFNGQSIGKILLPNNNRNDGEINGAINAILKVSLREHHSSIFEGGEYVFPYKAKYLTISQLKEHYLGHIPCLFYSSSVDRTQQ